MATFESIKYNDHIYLYAGDLSGKLLEDKDNRFIGLSLKYDDENHIQFDITNKFPLRDSSVDIFCAEDVMEHIEYSLQQKIFDEIYRILKPNGIFRLAVPDYRCDILLERTIKNKKGELKFDPGGGGAYSKIRNRVVKGGHVWFPRYESVKNIFDNSKFEDTKINYLHGYKGEHEILLKDIDYNICFIQRTPDNDIRVANPRRPMSIVVDAIK